MNEIKGERRRQFKFLSFIELIDLFSGRRYLILTVFFVSLILSAAVSFILPKTYRAYASLLVMAPKWQAELSPDDLSAQTYRKILLSDPLLDRVKRILNLDITLKQLKRNVGVDVLREKYGAEVQYSPLITLWVESDTPSAARDIANTWAEEFVSRISSMMVEGTEGYADFVLDQFTALETNNLLPAESTLTTRTLYYADTIANTEKEWDERITEFSSVWNIERMEEELKELHKTIAELRSELAAVQYKIDLTDKKLKQQRAQLKELPPTIALRKSITEDAFWEWVIAAQGSPVKPEDIEKLSMTSEEINPTHVELSKQAEETEVEHSVFLATRELLSRELKAIVNETDSLRKLKKEKELEIAKMEIDKKTEIDKLTVRKEIELAQLTRNVEKLRDTYKLLAPVSEAAKMSKNEEFDFVKIASKAVAPDYRIAPTRSAIVVLGTCGSTGLVIVLILLRLYYVKLREFYRLKKED